MKINQKATIDLSQDLILLCRKDGVDQSKIEELTGFSNINFDGDFLTSTMIYSKHGGRVYLLGLGEEKHQNRIDQCFRKLAFHEKKSWGKGIQVDLTGELAATSRLVTMGLEMANYEIGAFKSEKSESLTDNEVTFDIICDDDFAEELSEGIESARTINSIKALVDAPANVKTPDYLSKWALQSGKENDYEVKVWDEKALEKEGFHAILAVGKGSQYPPRLIQCSYLGGQDKGIDIVLVGKGITFDTGGISIKGSTNMHYMKSDMGGAAAVLGAIELVAKLKLKVNVIGLVGAAENAVDAKSYLPGDVIGSYSGKNIEIIDTDAEGRLVLADALNYAVTNLSPERIFDLATLTGSAVRTLGYYAAALFSHNDELCVDLQKLGDQIHEKVWRLPIFDELKEDIHSDIADVRNYSGRPIAGASAAAKFLEFFTEDHKNWVHLDIAGMAFGSSEYAKMKSASGFGVRLMTEYIKTLQS